MSIRRDGERVRIMLQHPRCSSRDVDAIESRYADPLAVMMLSTAACRSHAPSFYEALGMGTTPAVLWTTILGGSHRPPERQTIVELDIFGSGTLP